MKQEGFERLHAAEWAAFEAWLDYRALPKRQRDARHAPFPSQELPQRYRHLCQQLALARDREYGLSLVERLHALAQRGHDHLYGLQGGVGRKVWSYVTGGFARDVRAHRGWVLASFLLLFGPQLLMMLAVHLKPDLAHLVLDPQQLAHYEQMYSSDAQHLGRVARDASTDFNMFGFYIFNNVSIAFRCFAGGISAGLLTVFALVSNGLQFGVVEMRLIQAGLGENFHSFVIGHSGFELGAIVLSGAAGLRLGFTLLAPGQLGRGVALARAAHELIGMVCGLAVMLAIAALIEAFWSPLRLAFPIKIGVGCVLILVPLMYFLLAGRRHGS